MKYAQNEQKAFRNSDMKQMYDLGWTQTEIAQHYGVTQAAVSVVLNNPFSDMVKPKTKNERNQVIRNLRGRLPQKDIADLFGLTQARVSQLVKS